MQTPLFLPVPDSSHHAQHNQCTFGTILAKVQMLPHTIVGPTCIHRGCMAGCPAYHHLAGTGSGQPDWCSRHQACVDHDKVHRIMSL